MANLIRSATGKSASHWTNNDLMAYNIAPLPPSEFFPTPDPSLDNINPDILTSTVDDTIPTVSEEAAKYLALR